jgi:RHS repeat-associated protein
MYYTYDSSGNLISMNLSTKNADNTWTPGVEYYYIRNAQSDIIGLFNKAGDQVVSYVYDSWGKLESTTGTLASTVGVKNPYRYKGYRYDTETGLYYLQSRYYNAEWGRFINADGMVGQTGDLLGHNMFAYCKNNPVNMADPSGCFAIPGVPGWAAFGNQFDKKACDQYFNNYKATQSSSGGSGGGIIKSAAITGAFPSVVDSGTACALKAVNPIQKIVIPQRPITGGVSCEFIKYGGKPSLTAASGFYKYAGGAVTVAAFGYSVWDDCHRSNPAGRVAVDGVGLGIGIGIGIFLAPFELPVLLAVGASTVVGFGIGIATSKTKTALFGD